MFKKQKDEEVFQTVEQRIEDCNLGENYKESSSSEEYNTCSKAPYKEDKR